MTKYPHHLEAEYGDPLAPARGIVNALFLTGLFWSGVGIGFVLGRYL